MAPRDDFETIGAGSIARGAGPSGTLADGVCTPQLKGPAPGTPQSVLAPPSPPPMAESRSPARVTGSASYESRRACPGGFLLFARKRFLRILAHRKLGVWCLWGGTSRPPTAGGGQGPLKNRGDSAIVDLLDGRATNPWCENRPNEGLIETGDRSSAVEACRQPSAGAHLQLSPAAKGGNRCSGSCSSPRFTGPR